MKLAITAFQAIAEVERLNLSPAKESFCIDVLSSWDFRCQEAIGHSDKDKRNLNKVMEITGFWIS